MAVCKVGHDPFRADSMMVCLDCVEARDDRMAQLEKLVGMLERADLSHGVGCPAVFIDPRPCSCGLTELDIALADFQTANDARAHERNGNEYDADQNAE